MSRRDEDFRCKVYVGNLVERPDKREIEREFEYFGKLKNVWIARNPPGFAYIEYYNRRDALDAVDDLDGFKFDGRRCRVEMAKGPRKHG